MAFDPSNFSNCNITINNKQFHTLSMFINIICNYNTHFIPLERNYWLNKQTIIKELIKYNKIQRYKK